MKWDIKFLSMKCFYILTWHVAEVNVASVTPAKLVALQLGCSPKQAALVPAPAAVPQTQEPPENGDVVAYSLHVEWTFDEHVSDALGSQTHEVPPLQIGFNVVQPLCGNGFVIPTGAHMEQDPSSLHTYPESQVPCVLPLPCAPSTAHL